MHDKSNQPPDEIDILISSRFNSENKIKRARELCHSLRKQRINAYLVEANVGHDFGEVTDIALYNMKSMVALCDQDYGEKTASNYSTYFELRYAYENGKHIIPVKFCEDWPPKPPDDHKGGNSGKAQCARVFSNGRAHLDWYNKAWHPDACALEIIKVFEDRKDAADEQKLEHLKVDRFDVEEQLGILQAKLDIRSLIHDIQSPDHQVRSKLLYLTNAQAKEVANDGKIVDLMIKGFCGDSKPRMLINLVQSWGFYKCTTLMKKSVFEDPDEKKRTFCAGLRHNSHPFADDADESITMAQMESFIKNILIPLAEDTNAVIICSAVADDCALTETLLRVMTRIGSRWTDNAQPPFTIIRFLNKTEVLYMKDNIWDSLWPQIMQQNKSWKLRHEYHLEDHYLKMIKKKKAKNSSTTKDEDVVKSTPSMQDKQSWWRGHDLDFSVGNLIIVEGLDCSSTIDLKQDHYPSALFMSSIMNRLGCHIQTLIIKTGATVRSRIEFNPNAVDSMSLQILVERIEAGSDVLCLDVRRRNQTRSDDNAPQGKAIDNVQTLSCILDKFSSSYLSTIRIEKELENDIETWMRESCFGILPNKDEILDCCALAYLDSEIKKWGKEWTAKEIKKLKKERHIDGSETENDTGTTELLDDDKIENLYKQKLKELEGINERKKSAHNSIKSDMKRDLSYFFAKQFFEQFNEEFETETFKKECKLNMTKIQDCLTSQKFHSLNIWSNDEINSEYIRNKILCNAHSNDEVPTTEELDLLKDAWSTVVFATDNANRYKMIAKSTTAVELGLSVLITLISVSASNISEEERLRQVLEDSCFLLILFLAGTLASEALLSPRKKWKRLRIASIELESLIWKFRANVGTSKSSSESILEKGLQKWKGYFGGIPHMPLSKGRKEQARWKLTPFGMLKAECFRSRNSRSSQSKDGCDDLFSFVDSEKYQQYRVEKVLQIYARKMPKENNFQFLILLLAMCTVAVSNVNFQLFKGKYSTDLVTVMMMMITCFKSWGEFNGFTNDLYPKAIRIVNSQKKCEHSSNLEKQLEIFQNFVNFVENTIVSVAQTWASSLECVENKKFT